VPSKKKLLILSVSAGAGHVRAAQAVEAAARAATPSLDPTHLDLLSIAPADFRKFYGAQYLKLVEALPQLWSYLYSKTDRPSRNSLIGDLKRAAEKFSCPRPIW
jgi:processive 1,2-diacylglycerol beta-glucosyltransferase